MLSIILYSSVWIYNFIHNGWMTWCHKKHKSHLKPPLCKMRFSSNGENSRKPSLICKKEGQLTMYGCKGASWKLSEENKSSLTCTTWSLKIICRFFVYIIKYKMCCIYTYLTLNHWLSKYSTNATYCMWLHVFHISCSQNTRLYNVFF